MADYIYLLENRLSEAQRSALGIVRQIARDKGLTVFLVGGAVRDLTSGSPVRDLDVAVQGNALKLRKELEQAGGLISGSSEPRQALYLQFPGGVRMEVGSTLTVTFPKPGKPVVKPSTILDDLRRRDFTANAMALSLNDGSFGLLMDPLNGVADIENRELRLVSNYGFIEDPVRMIRAVRYAARLGWELEEKTRVRYETGKEEGYISALDDFSRGYEAEEIVHEEDPLRIMRRLESEGWMQILMPGWTVAKANVSDLEKVRESQTQLQMQGINPDASAINFPLLTAKMSAKEIQTLKTIFPRPGFVSEINAMEGEAKDFAAALGGRGASVPSAAYRAILSAKPEALLYVLYTTKSGALQTKLKSFMTDWPQARQKIPYALMQEMRITPEIAGYNELVEKLFFELMDGKLTTAEEMRAYLEPYSPPAPPPPVNVRRPRSSKKDAKGKGKGKKGAIADLDGDDDESPDLDADSDEAGGSARSGVEEDEEAEDAAEEFDSVAELGGGTQARKSSAEDEEEEDEDVEPAVPRKEPAAKKAAPAAKAPASVAPAPAVEGPATKLTEVPAAPKSPTKAKETAVAPMPPVPVEEQKPAVKAVTKSATKKAAQTAPVTPAKTAASGRKPTVVAVSAKVAAQAKSSANAKHAAPAKSAKVAGKAALAKSAKKPQTQKAPVKAAAKSAVKKGR